MKEKTISGLNNKSTLKKGGKSIEVRTWGKTTSSKVWRKRSL